MKFKLIILFLALIKFVMNDTMCLDGTTCPGTQKCCANKEGFSCCPYSDGVCCVDMKHCCPPNHECTNKGICKEKA